MEGDYHDYHAFTNKKCYCKNRTGEDLRDIHLTYESLGKSSLKISHIYNDMQQTKLFLYLTYLNQLI